MNQALSRVLGMTLAALCTGALGAAAQSRPASRPPHQIYQELNALRVDAAQIYSVHDLEVRRDSVSLSFTDGTIGFFTAFDGRVTGAVFTGRGRTFAVPRDPVEKASLAQFLGVPLLDQHFTSAYMRFSDGAGEELLRDLNQAGAKPFADPAFVTQWDASIGSLNPDQSLRLLSDLLSDHPLPFFDADLLGETTGPFEVRVDERLAEQVLIGQTHFVNGAAGYDIWASFRRDGAAERPTATFLPQSYALDTTIEPDHTLAGNATLTLSAVRGGERVVPLELSRFLSVQSVADDSGAALEFFQNEALSQRDIAARGDDVVLVVLPQAPAAGQTVHLRLRYRGDVISNAGNGVLFVGNPGNWYPHISGADHFAPFELSFRWPRGLQLAANGQKLDELEDSESSTGRWRSEGPMALAGFNVGLYATDAVDAGNGVKVELYANHTLEQSLADRLRSSGAPPDPAAMLKQLGTRIAAAVRYEEGWLGPLPFHTLEVSPVPVTYGQGWPGLLYLPTFSYLPREAQQAIARAGGGPSGLPDTVPYHEIAHQWWGNIVGWSDYRDQWIDEALASYMALVGTDAEQPQDHALTSWLERYRTQLTTKVPGGEALLDDAGPLVLGYRLELSRTPGVYDTIISGKGAWVFQMLRMMLREPGASNPDARFQGLLRSLLAEYNHKALTTDELQAEIERVMTPAMALEGGHSMDWFFDQWVRATGIPRYAVEFTAQPSGKEFVVRGTLKQSGVPESFLASVPLYTQDADGKPILLGSVVTQGDETQFRFTSPIQPQRILIDPDLTLLCLPQ